MIADRARELLGGASLRRSAPIVAAALDTEAVVVGYATIDLDRAVNDARKREPDIGIASPSSDGLLGARAIRLSPAPGEAIVLLEPATEGRLAASLARFGEGPVALYVLAGPDALARLRGIDGLATSRPADGPFGPSVLVLGGPVWGAHLIVVAASVASPGEAAAGTIPP